MDTFFVLTVGCYWCRALLLGSVLSLGALAAPKAFARDYKEALARCGQECVLQSTACSSTITYFAMSQSV
jgi:hypothetical protein